MKWPLRNQITLPLLALALASLAAVGCINARQATRHAQQQIESRLRGVVGVLTAANFPLTGSVLRQMRDLSSAEYVLVGGQGEVQASSLSNTPPLAQGPRFDASLDGLLGPPVDIDGEPYFHASIQLGHADSPRPRTLHILFPQAEYQRHWREAFVPPLIVGVAALAALAGVATLVAQRISRAMTKLSREVLRLARGNFAPFELPKTDDEIRDLSIAVNRTAEMLADYERQVRRAEQMRTVAVLGASLVHEMRNAATGCRLAIELHAETCNAPGEDETLAVAKRQLHLMESQLRRLMQIGKPPLPLEQQPIDLRRLVDDLLPLVRPTALHAEVRLDWQAPDQALATYGDREQLSQAVLNLILNALEAARQDSQTHHERRVAIQLTQCNGHAELAVCDSGPGPRDELAPSLFEPFVTSKPEGAGLGLAMSRQVIEAHAGTIQWQRADAMTRFYLRLPLTKANTCV